MSDAEKRLESNGSFELDDTQERVFDAEMDQKVWRKLDMYLLPVVAMFYLLSFLDRTNIANARVAGFQKDLGITNHQYSIALTVTYVPYIAAELPSNLLLKAVGPNKMLPTMLTLWGVVTALQGIVKTYSGLLVARFFLGLLEGGVFPGLVLYLSYFYPRYKMNLRICAFFSSASLSGAFSGILAYGIIQMSGVGNRPGWSWIFILEGVFTVAFGLASYFLLPRSVEAARFLTQKEKEYVVAVLREDSAHQEEERFTWREVGEAFKLPQVWFMGFVFFLSGVIVFSLAYFSPSIINSLGYTAARAQLMSVPPYAAAFTVAMTSSYFSDHYRRRGVVAIFASTLCIIGFSMFLGSRSSRVQYGSLFFSISGAFTAAPALGAWSSNNASPQTRRATAIAISFIMTNSGGILSTWLLASLSAPPRYTTATITLLVFSVGKVFGCVANLLYLSGENRKKAEVRARINREEEGSGLGDRSAWFIYAL